MTIQKSRCGNTPSRDQNRQVAVKPCAVSLQAHDCSTRQPVPDIRPATIGGSCRRYWSRPCA
eukprot:4720627-Pyramimonas_sp.AAC.1